MADFPYLVLTAKNRRRYSGIKTAPGKPNSTGYQGWQRPGGPAIMQAGQSMTKIIPRSEWKDRIRAGQGNMLSDIVKRQNIPVKNQDGLGYCWVYGSVSCVEMARAKAGLPFVQLSPESVGGPCTGWRNEGGYASQAFDQLESHGACHQSMMNRENSLQWRSWQEGWQTDALNHRVLQWYDLGNDFPIYDEVISCLLQRMPVSAGLGWWGHLIVFVDAIILPDDTVGVLARNSWGADWPGIDGLANDGWFCLDEDSATPDGAAAPIVVTLTD